MYRIKAFLVFALLACFSSCSEDKKERTESAFSDPVIRDIYTLAYQRNASQLLTYSNHENAAYRTSFARVSGSVLAPKLFEPLQKLLRDPIPYVRLYAAFSVGQYRDTTALPALEKAIKKATIPEIKAEVLEAIGKSANRNAMDYLVFHEPSTAIEEAGKIWGIYRGMLQGQLREEHLRTVVAHLKSRERETRLAAAHTLSRQNQFELDDQLPQIMEALQGEKDGEIRSLLIRCLGKTSNPNPTLLKSVVQDSDPRARAEAISQLANPMEERGLNILISALEDGAVWVAMAAAQKSYDVSIPAKTIDKIKNLALTSPIPEVRAAVLIALLNANHEEADYLWEKADATYGNEIEKAVLFKNLYRFPDALDTIKFHALKDSPLGSAAFEALVKGAEKREDWRSALYAASVKSLESGLLTQSYLVAHFMRQSSLADTTKVSVEKLQNAHEKLQFPAAIETRMELEKTIASIRNVELEKTSPGSAKAIDWDLIQSIPKNAEARIYTNQGNLTLKLLIEDAPASVSNFVRLADEKFYDGTAFHRIVPVFVSQGGGTRGDGFGSTPYNIRSEFSPLHFGTGVAGLASAGKDTEGCQFFFSHISTPHLDGRYTIFGSLSDGFQTLSEIQTGATIDSIRVDF